MTLPQDNKKLKPVTIYRQDGSSEVVYIDTDQPSLRDGLSFVYIIVGIVALSLTAYITAVQIKNMRKNG